MDEQKPLSSVFFVAILVSVMAVLITVMLSVQATHMEATPTPTCAIKGNINRAGERIYHLQSSPFYTKTIINPAHGEKYFCTEQEAVNEGWRRALQP